MSDLHWMPLYIADYLADTTHLSTEEHGAYLLLIMHYWQQNGLPDDDVRLARIARLSPEQWDATRPALRPFFGAGWFHSRVEVERAKAGWKFEKLSAAGKKGGRPRKTENPGEKPLESQAFETTKALRKPGLSYSQSQSHTNNPIQEGKNSKGPSSTSPLTDPLGKDAFGGIS
ncbi:MAG: DUF1376 domain-containing protein [Mesorhizobium sp.]|uniref:YdaU family protein n=1 Tax=Mesorhizobium sp. TaxID=1871066 RepID=UPI00120E07B1|nr:DUF1376 domain-containing protein [Mesorhizobium sp.]TIL56551.1 MAG: DUF1376 domain-containing protein [Mesorhizobium sp.]